MLKLQVESDRIEEGSDLLIMKVDADGYLEECVIDLTDCGLHCEEARELAHVLAAAPEMYEALKDLTRRLETMIGKRTLQSAARFGGTTFDMVADAKRAIAKAGGKQTC